MSCFNSMKVILLAFLAFPGSATAEKLAWPIGCIPGIDCLQNNTFHVSYPDIDGDGKAFDCSPPGYTGHTGTDVAISSVDDGVSVLAADDGEILWVSGGKYDRCPNEREPDCNPELRPVLADSKSNSPNCSDFGPSCGAEDCCLSWGFNAGNFIIIKHATSTESYLTFYAHLRKGSIIVASGQLIRKGDKIAEVGSSGASLVPHLHFGVWTRQHGRYELADPWAGKCGPNFNNSLWQYNPPYRADVTVSKRGTGTGIVTDASGLLNCGNNCTASFTPGSVITFKATPYSGSEFIGWEGECAGKGNSCALTVEGTMSISAIYRDIAAPTVRSLTLSPFSSSLTVPVVKFTAYDNVRVTGYMIGENPTQPQSTSSSWNSECPSSYTCSSSGNKTLYAWVKDAAGNISTSVKTRIECGATNSAKSLNSPDLIIPPFPFLYSDLLPDGT